MVCLRLYCTKEQKNFKNINIYNKRCQRRVVTYEYNTQPSIVHSPIVTEGCRGPDRMVVGFKTAYAISAYHH